MRLIVCLLLGMAALGTAACDPTSTDTRLVGNWSMPRQPDLTEDGFAGPNRGFDVITFKADGTFSEMAHPTEAPPAHILSGTWRVEDGQLELKFNWAHPTMKDMVGQELRLVIVDLKPDTFVLANAEHQKQRLVWTRVK